MEANIVRAIRRRYVYPGASAKVPFLALEASDITTSSVR
jgi:hypothetical protein